MKKEISCCFTGYRPHKFPFALNETSEQYRQMENRLYNAIFSMPEQGCCTFYCGMASGFDIIAGEIVLQLKELHKDKSIVLVAAVPFREQPKAFTSEWKRRYSALLSRADETVILSEEYHRACFAIRNNYMIDNSDVVITWFDGQSGGTAQAIKYARKKGKKIININEIYEEPNIPLPYILD